MLHLFIIILCLSVIVAFFDFFRNDMLSQWLYRLNWLLFHDNYYMGPLIVSDSSFTNWMMKPFTSAILTPEERNFNYRLSRARMVTECAYGQLKGRFRVLHRKSECNEQTTKPITLACVVLHNICMPRTLRTLSFAS